MSVKINSYKGRSIRPVYRERIKKDEYSNAIDRICNRYKLGHIKQNESGREYKNRMNKLFSDDVIQSMKKYSHHGRTSLFGHSVHVSYYNYLVCKKLHLDEKAGAKAGLLHDLFLYDWHKYSPEKGERLHGFEHPTKALKNAGKYFNITEKEGDMIAKHMFPLTVTPPKYKETFVIVLVDKFCSFNEVLDDFIHRKFCGAKDTRIKWFGAGKGEKR